MLTLKEVADRLRLSEEGARALVKSGDLKAMKAGPGLTSPWRITEEALAEYIERQTAKAAS
jgi:excisionase family DNA binding protein